MKKSELKSYIKEMIVNELTVTEVDVDKTRGTVVMPKATNPAEVKKLTDQGVDVELKEELDDIEPSASDIDNNLSVIKLKSKHEGVVKLMKSIANKWKNADGPEKDKFFAQLKDLTKIKKELEALMNPSMEDDDEEF
jgi:hypothetical protein